MNNKYFQLAIEEAKKGVGFTSPNPVVGAVVVRKNKVLSLGFHKQAGKDHAEVVAIKKVKNKTLLKDSELYVTLEPCCHYGKTPPCTELIINSGIKKVFIGMKDSSKKVNGKGINYLRKNGVQVEMCKDKKLIQAIKDLNKPFVKNETVGLPYVVLKAGVSLDGKIATKTGDSKWITNNEARKDARLERSLCDAVLVGAGTVKADNPELASHGKHRNKKLLRIILDADLSTDIKAKVYRDKNVFVASTDLALEKRKNIFIKAGIEYKSFGKTNVNIKNLLKFLGQRDLQKIFVEGGGEVHGSLVDAHQKYGNIVDEVIFYIALKIIGGREAKSVVGGDGIKNISEVTNLTQVIYKQVGDNLKVKAFLR